MFLEPSEVLKTTEDAHAKDMLPSKLMDIFEHLTQVGLGASSDKEDNVYAALYASGVDSRICSDAK
jgi:hypothetical protein